MEGLNEKRGRKGGVKKKKKSGIRIDLDWPGWMDDRKMEGFKEEEAILDKGRRTERKTTGFS